jgi:LPXTG-motif cell wall-anchored protein
MVYHYRYDYYIVEQSVEGYTATYIDPDTGAALEPEAMPVEDAAAEADASMEESTTKTLAVYPATGSVAIKNTRTYVMPSTGGTGTRRYTMGGAAIVLTASALYILSRRRRLQRGRGGEI